MSTVAAIRDETGVVHLASDLMARDSNGRKFETKGKWIVGGTTDNGVCVGSWALGHCGHLRASQVLQDALAGPREAPMNIIKFIRDVLEGDGFRREEDKTVLNYGQEFIWATREVLWRIAMDFSVEEYDAGRLCVIGSGDYFAEGAAFGSARYTKNAEEILCAAMDAALRMDAGTGMRLYRAMIG